MIMHTRRISIVSVGLAFLLALLMGGSAFAYSGILAFGDSLSDNGTGALNGNPDDIYGFQRYSNGPVWVEYLASDHLNVPLLDMAYGGATTAYDNPAAYSSTKNEYYLGNTGLLWQLGAYAAAHPSGIPSGTLVALWAGGNDMFNLRSTSAAASNIGAAIQILYNLGGRDFIIPNLSYNDTDPYLAWKKLFDEQLAAVVDLVAEFNPDINIVLLDLNKLEAACDFLDGTYLEQTHGPGTYLSYDGVHPTTEIHCQIADYAAQAIPLPATVYLFISGLTMLAGIKRRFR
jgi:phospholipase/lecithinase/hemolysin